ncbi:MAG: hypothetical protein GTO03_10545, partial [Planctomycetales bacterium]|nr:hypothetical protein [Planctomycetales bacterium]
MSFPRVQRFFAGGFAMRRVRGVTLIELLVAILIVIMLASMVLFALQRAQVSARQARTQALVAKLHNIISQHWATYQTRRVPVDARAVDEVVNANGVVDANLAARFRLSAIRQIIRMELPDRWSEVYDINNEPDYSPVGVYDPSDGDQVADVSPLKDFSTGATWTFTVNGLPPGTLPPPSASLAYLNYYRSVSQNYPNLLPTEEYQSA